MKFVRNSALLPSLLAVALILSWQACQAETAEPSDRIFPAANGMSGKVFCGYQGWYRAPDDNSGLGWMHYETYSREFEPGRVGIDYWPDMSEYSEEERFMTPFRHADGSPASVFSSAHPDTVERHFRWMAEYGIDGVFLQRFAVDVTGSHSRAVRLERSNNQVLDNVRRAANKHERAFALMYDLSGMRSGTMGRVIEDWKKLAARDDLLNDPGYIKESGRPVIGIWGVGFSDGRDYTLSDVEELVEFFKNDPQYGGFHIILGVPTYWRTLERDTVDDPELHQLLARADTVMPWFVGRFSGVDAAARQETEILRPDIAWCEETGLGYMPVIFPGFSWANRLAEQNAVFDQIPRENGRFLWAQALAATRAGAQTLYVAMFDEMDEGTQIFKVANDPPVGESRFLTYEPQEPDFYLRLTGAIARLLRGELSPSPGATNPGAPGNDLMKLD